MGESIPQLTTIQGVAMKTYMCIFMLIGEIQCCNMWVKRTVSHPQELRQGKKISSSTNTEMENANKSMNTIADTDSAISHVWKPIIGNNLVEDVNYNKFDKIEEPEIITLESLQNNLKSRQFSKIVKSIITVENSI